MVINGNAGVGKPLLKAQHLGMGGIFCEHHAAHHKPLFCECFCKAQGIHIVSYAQIAANLALFNILGADNYHDFCFILQLKQHLKLAVRLKAGKHPCSMVIVKKLAAEFTNSLANSCGLHF